MSTTSTAPPPTATRIPNYVPISTLSAHSRAITALRFSPDGTLLASAGADGWLHFWHSTSGQHIRGFRAHKAGINDITISPDSLYIATASDDHTSDIHLLHPPPGVTFYPPPLEPSDASDTEDRPVAPVPPQSAVSSSSSTVPAIRHLVSHTAPILSVAFSPKSNLLATGSFDESTIIWDVRRGKVLRQLPAHADAVWCVAWDAEGEMVLTAGADGLIRLWDASTGQCLKTLDNDTNSPISHAAFTPSSVFLQASTLSSTLRIYNIHTGKIIKTIRAPGTFVSERWPCPAVIYEGLPPLSRDNESNGHSDPPKDEKMDVDYAQKDQEPVKPPVAMPNVRTKMRDAWIISGSENGKLIVWDIQSKRVLQILEGDPSHSCPVVALAVSPDGRTIASGSLEPEKVIKLWRDVE
ncbi:hypothetical protein I312_100526 [Cryptococcus bacillisporus CA1280]|uniref:Chromatin binding protein n=1 Tax=Cryptococcus bacillisporus CA1280 TaxID=1296109 RepID=A0A0D0TTZ3_CRYGA|nr:chromatin binding protein [Cryptococcus bacillisporus CA1280]